MKIHYIGNSQSVIENLRNLGADIIFSQYYNCSGIIVTDDIPTKYLVSLRKVYHGPIIVKGFANKNYYTDVNVIVFDENDIKVFYERHQIRTLEQCKNKLKELKIHYLVVALTKEQIQKHVEYNLPKAEIKEVNVTNKTLISAKDNLTALVGYIYAKEGTLSAEAINKANIGAALSVVGFANEGLRDYYLDIKFKKGNNNEIRTRSR